MMTNRSYSITTTVLYVWSFLSYVNAVNYLRDGTTTSILLRDLQTTSKPPIIELPTIDEIILNEPNVTTLATAFQTSGLVGALCNNCNYTVFAPSNTAFDDAFDATFLNTLLSPSWILHLQNLLAFHATTPTNDGNRILSTDYKDGQLFTMLNGENITILDLKSGIQVSSPLTSNGSKIIQADLLASNGVVQIVDTVLLPGFLGIDVFALGDISVEFTILQELINIIELSGSIQDGELTLLAPTNAAFLALGSDTLNALKADTIQLGKVLANHIIIGVHPSISLVNGLVLESLGGFNITITVSSETARQAFTNPPILMFNDATVTRADILARNGIAHGIDTVLIDPSNSISSNAPLSVPSDVPSSLPSDVPSDAPSDTPSDVPTLVPSIFDLSEIDSELSVLDELFELSGLDDELEGEFTLLAPENDAWFALGNDTLSQLRNNIDVLDSLLRNHLIAGIIPPSALANGALLTTLGGLNVTVAPTVARSTLFLAAQQVVTFRFNAATSSAVYFAGNGIVYKIDEVLSDPDFPVTTAPTQVPIAPPPTTSSPVVVVPPTEAPVVVVPPTEAPVVVVETTSPTVTPTMTEATPDPTSIDVVVTQNPSSLPITIPSDVPSLTPTMIAPCDLNQTGTECCIVSDCGISSTIDFVCESNKCIGQGDPRFTLTWFGNDDLDLHVITPNGFEIFFGARMDPVSGGQLDQDDTAGGIDTAHVENVFFPLDGSAPNGTYTYFVDNFSQRDLDPDPWTLEVFIGEILISSNSGATESGGVNQFFNYTRE